MGSRHLLIPVEPDAPLAIDRAAYLAPFSVKENDALAPFLIAVVHERQTCALRLEPCLDVGPRVVGGHGAIITRRAAERGVSEGGRPATSTTARGHPIHPRGI